MRRLVIVLFSALPLSGFAQAITCNQTAPTVIQPGQSATLTFTATNGGSAIAGSAFAFFVTVSVNLVSNIDATLPHIRMSSPQSNNPVLDSCHTNVSAGGGVSATCFNSQPATFPAGGVFSLSATFSVDAGAPAAGAIVDGTISNGSSIACSTNSDLAIGNTCTTTLSAPSVAQSNQDYTVSWTPTFPPPVFYDLDESTTSDFSSGVVTHTPGNAQQTFNKNVSPAITFYYRVRSHDCNGSPGPYSNVAKVVVQAPPQPVVGPADSVVPFGSTAPVAIPLSITGPPGGFNATADKPFLSVSPASGNIPSSGSTTVTATANPTNLPPGANTGTVTVTSTGGSTIATIPVSVSLVTPVMPGAKSGTLPPNTLILPVITHVNGASAVFQSDVRVTNGSLADISYQLLLTPTRSNATQVGVQTVVPATAGQTIAFNDIAKDFFGFGATGQPNDQGFGSLQIIPLNTSSLLTFASSRTYATAGNGTFGQFVPVSLLSSFATQGKVLSLQHVAQSSAFHTNLGLVEGSGVAANGRVRIIDDTGTVLQTVPFSLQPGEHQQINNFISSNGVATLADGRLEVLVDSATGAVTAYASVLDNITQDPYAVAPVQASTIAATRFIAPGVADLGGAANFHSDLRIYNGGSTSQTVNLTFFPQITVQPVIAQPITIGAGQVSAINDVLPSIFNVTGTGGSVLITTASPASLVTTVRTYSKDATGGTFGQFIPGVTPSQGVGAGERGLQVLQLEQSAAFRSNVGIVELTGNTAHVRLTLILPDSKTSPSTEFDIKPNEFRQFNSVIASMTGQPNTYNARMIVEVTSGSGRVTAYGSVIDNRTQDPTYVPAQ
jgi:BACON domain-containing protein